MLEAAAAPTASAATGTTACPSESTCASVLRPFDSALTTMPWKELVLLTVTTISSCGATWPATKSLGCPGNALCERVVGGVGVGRETIRPLLAGGSATREALAGGGPQAPSCFTRPHIVLSKANALRAESVTSASSSSPRGSATAASEIDRPGLATTDHSG